MQFCSIYWTYISFLAVTEFDSQTSEKGASWKTSQPLQFLRILCVMRRNDILFSISTYYYGNTWNVFTQWRSSFKSTSHQNNTMIIRSEASKHAFLPSTTEGSVDCVQDNACTKAEWFEAFAKGVICKNDHSWIESKFHFLNNNRRPKVQSQTYKEFLPVNITRLAQLENLIGVVVHKWSLLKAIEPRRNSPVLSGETESKTTCCKLKNKFSFRPLRFEK